MIYYQKRKMIKKIKITPLHDRVYVLPLEAEQMTKGGIIIPATAKQRSFEGVVVAAGPGRKDDPLKVKVGDKILYEEGAGSEREIDGTVYLCMRESQVESII